MEIVKLVENDAGEYWAVEPYRRVLPELVSRLPAGAADFAADPDHYDYHAERCTKDLKLVTLDYVDDGEELAVVASFRFNELRVADELSIRYLDVSEFSITAGSHNPAGPTRLGDLAVDEVLPSPTGASHELMFHGGRIWVLCSDLQAVWSSPSIGEGDGTGVA